MSPGFFRSRMPDFSQLTGVSKLITDYSCRKEKGVVSSRTISWCDTLTECQCVRRRRDRSGMIVIQIITLSVHS